MLVVHKLAPLAMIAVGDIKSVQLNKMTFQQHSNSLPGT